MALKSGRSGSTRAEYSNISKKNKTFCELTGLYWAWQNLNNPAIGLVHYRRYLGAPKSFFWRFCKLVRKKRNELFLSIDQINDLLEKYDLILPYKRHYWIETRESQYSHAHHHIDLETVEIVLKTLYPSYLPAWQKMLLSRSGHICNMFVMKREFLDEYCNWLFAVLFKVEDLLDISQYNDYDRRVFGFLAERMLDVYIETNQLNYIEVPMINLESQKWLKKGFIFLKRKFFKSK